MKDEKKKSWEEVITSTDLTHNSRRAWQTIRKLSNDPTTPNPPCLVHANQVAHQLLINGQGTMSTKQKRPILPPIQEGTISSYTRWNYLATTDANKSRLTPILTVRCSFQRVSTGPDPPKAPTDVGRCTSEPRPCYKIPMSSMYSQRRGISYKYTSCSGWVHAKCSGILNAAQYRRKSYWTCDTCLAPSSQQSPPPTLSPAPPTEQISDDITFKVLQLNANGIGNKLTGQGVVLERNKVKVAEI